MSIKFEGLDEVLEAIEVFDEAELKRALGKACAIVERSAKQKAPKGTGELRNSISSRIEGDTGIVFTPLEYAPYVEYGTSKMKEQPFMNPAIEDNIEMITYIISKELKD